MRQGVLRQLQQVVKHCQGAAHAVIARKVRSSSQRTPCKRQQRLHMGQAPSQHRLVRLSGLASATDGLRNPALRAETTCCPVALGLRRMWLQVLRVVQTLPAGPDDLHTIISAHGSFAGALADLCRMDFPLDVRPCI